MVQAIFETLFDVCYLTWVIAAGVIMFTRGKADSLIRKFGLMAILLGSGDAFHLVARMYALWTTGLEANAAALGIGKLVTSVTMTVFYLILYYIWRERYDIQGRRGLTAWMWILSAARVLLCLLPQNEWLTYDQPLLFGILRNIPFAVMGVLIIVLFAQEAKKANDRAFHFMALAVALSFGFYIPVVLFGSSVPVNRHADDPENACLRLGGADGLGAVPGTKERECEGMSKRYVTSALIYALLAMACGVFFREFTKYLGYTGFTTLSVMHTHYFALGTVFFLLLALLEKAFLFSSGKGTSIKLALYHAGLNITVLGLLLRGLPQALGAALSKGMDAGISGISGLGHILLGVSMVLLLLQMRKSAK